MKVMASGVGAGPRSSADKMGSITSRRLTLVRLQVGQYHLFSPSGSSDASMGGSRHQR
jgi:hypothetical protein